MFQLGSGSLAKLKGVHPDLVRVVKRAIELSEIDFTVTYGTRTVAEQRQMVAKGVSTTMNSRHIPTNGYAHAVDLGALRNGSISYDWPLYHKLAAAMKAAAKELGVPVEWGGDWKTFKDGPHFQLPYKLYP